MNYRDTTNQPTSSKEVRVWNRTLSEQEWCITEKLRTLLKLPNKIMRKLQTRDVPTISLLAPFIHSLVDYCRGFLNDDCGVIQRAAKDMIEEIQKRFSFLKDPIYYIATFLDPRTKHIFGEVPLEFQIMVRQFISDTFEAPNEAPSVSSPVCVG